MSARQVLISGAGSGFGRALAQRFAAAGCRIGCADINADSARETAAMLPGDGHRVYQVDVADDASVARWQSEVAALGQPVDVLINNAGIASGGTLLEADMAEWDRVLNINLLGVVRACRAFLPGMQAAGRGHIVNVASFAALAGGPGIMTYGVAKGGVHTLSEQLRAELHGSGITVSVVCPAFFQTNLLSRWEGSERMRGVAEKLMRESPDTLDSVSTATFDAIERGDFLILPTRREPGRWRIKRWFPNLYFRQLMKLVASRSRGG